MISKDEHVEEQGTAMSGSGIKVGKAKNKPTIKARWLNTGSSNRVTPPDVVKGETVFIYKMGEANQYYWTLAFNETDLRKKESVLHLYSNTDEHGEELTDKNSYSSLFDTKNKKINVKTSANDGEATTWDINLNTKAGVLTVKDGNGNTFKHNAKAGTLEAIYSSSVLVKSPKITLDGDVTVTKDLHVKGKIDDVKGDLTGHKHSTTDGATANPR